MPSHYTAPEMFLFTDTKFKIRIEYTEYQYEATEKHVISMVVDGEKGFLSNQETATNGCEEGQNHGRDLTKGQLINAFSIEQVKTV